MGRPDAVRVGGWLVALALGYVVLHHGGTIFAGLGEVGDTRTRWADWIDLATPFVVTGAAAGALRAGSAGRRVWTLFWFAAVLYTEGHGVHLAANSVGNTLRGHTQPAYLWDEHVGHYLWYAGFYLIVLALGLTLATRRPTGRIGPGGHLLALLVGLTNFTNAVEGQTPYLGLAAAAGLGFWGLRTRAGLGRLLLTAYAFSMVLFVVFGVWQRGFPEFTELGWI